MNESKQGQHAIIRVIHVRCARARNSEVVEIPTSVPMWGRTRRRQDARAHFEPHESALIPTGVTLLLLSKSNARTYIADARDTFYEMRVCKVKCFY